MLLCRINLDHNGEWDGLPGGRLTIRSLTNSDTPLANGDNAGWTGTDPRLPKIPLFLGGKVVKIACTHHEELVAGDPRVFATR